MSLSKWPDSWQNRRKESVVSDLVECEFYDYMFVAAVTEAAVGLKENEDDRDVAYWVPISLIDGETPSVGTWIESITIPEWKADELGI